MNSLVSLIRDTASVSRNTHVYTCMFKQHLKLLVVNLGRGLMHPLQSVMGWPWATLEGSRNGMNIAAQKVLASAATLIAPLAGAGATGWTLCDSTQAQRLQTSSLCLTATTDHRPPTNTALSLNRRRPQTAAHFLFLRSCDRTFPRQIGTPRRHHQYLRTAHLSPPRPSLARSLARSPTRPIHIAPWRG